MRWIAWTVMAVLGLLAAPAWAQSEPRPAPSTAPTPSTTPMPSTTPEPSTGGTAYEARFADHSTLQLTMLDGSILVNTRYGKLNIPMTEVKRIELGFRYPEGVEKKIADACEDLGSMDFRRREEAKKILLAHRELSVPMLKKAMKSTVFEAAKSAEELMARLEGMLPKEKLEPREYDTLVTNTMTVRGVIEQVGFRAKTRYFGETTIQLTDLRELRQAGSPAFESIVLDSSKHAKQQWAAWYDTGIEVTTDLSLEISATGRIDQWSQTPGQYMCTPAGNQSNVVGPPQQSVPGVLYKTGAVYGRIGEKGEIFYVGERYQTAKPPASGKLYLIIAPSNWGNDSVGEYKVSVKKGD